MSSVLHVSLLAVGAAQLMHGPARIFILSLGLVGLFVPQLILGLAHTRWPRGTWIYFLLIAAIGAVQSLSTGDIWPVLSAATLAVALLLFLSIAPRIATGITFRTTIAAAGLFLLATAYATVDREYIEAVRSSAPPLALAALVLAGMTCRKRTVVLFGATLFVLLVLVWNSRAEALAVFVYLATYIFQRSRGGLRKTVTVALAVSVVLLLALSEFWVSALKLDDAYRGVGSGLTGRITGFQYSLDLIAERPGFGVGYRRQELYFEDAGFWVGRVEYPISSSHNGVLGILIEWGILGALLWFAPLIGRGRIFVRSISESQALPVLVSFLAFIMFERYYINFGNLYSIIMIALIVSWLKLHQASEDIVQAEPMASRS
jgi:hypothetical protein